MVTFVLALALGCGDGDGGSNADGGGSSGSVVLSGAVEKGPFVLGSAVSVSPVSATGNPTGSVFNTQTVNDLGEFSLEISYLGNVALQGEGFYYNEILGRLSTAPITLRGYYEVTADGTQTAYLNLLTHLTSERTRSLMAGGLDLPTAIAQAEDELVVALGIGPVDFDPASRATDMNILGGDTDANAYLLAVSAILAQAAALTEGPIDAELQELVNKVALDLGEDGALSSTLIADLVAAERAIDPAAVMSALRARLDDLGSSATVPDLDRMLDTDQDDIVNAADNCPTVPNTGQDNADDDDRGDACDCVEPPGEFCYGVSWVEVPADALGSSNLAIVDLDGDGDRDLVVQDVESRLFWSHNDGAGEFATTALSEDTNAFVRVMDFGDVNSDGHLDVVSADPGSVAYSLGDGVGNLGAVAYVGHGVGIEFECAVAADINGDGDVDVVLSEPGGLNVVAGDGLGGWTSTLRVDAIVSSSAFELSATDLNDDGAEDVVMSGPAGVLVWLTDGAGGLTAPASAIGMTGVFGVELADLEGDGDTDIVAFGADKFQVLFGDGAGSFVAGPETTGIGATFPAPGSLADIDNDGVLDVVVIRETSGENELVFYVGDGDGGFASPVALRTAAIHSDLVSPGTRVAAADLNGDGFADLVPYGFDYLWMESTQSAWLPVLVSTP